jgi:hypothetical protein
MASSPVRNDVFQEIPPTSLLQIELEDSSLYDDDYLILSVARTVHNYSNAKRSHDESVIDRKFMRKLVS